MPQSVLGLKTVMFPYHGLYDLEQKLIYKAKQNQSTVIKVDPRYTSQCCPMCGHIEKTNRNKRYTCLLVRTVAIILTMTALEL